MPKLTIPQGYTPGPWRWRWNYLRGGTDGLIARMTGVSTLTKDEQQANHAILALAPEMAARIEGLEAALVQMVWHLGSDADRAAAVPSDARWKTDRDEAVSRAVDLLRSE